MTYRWASLYILSVSFNEMNFDNRITHIEVYRQHQRKYRDFSMYMFPFLEVVCPFHLRIYVATHN